MNKTTLRQQTRALLAAMTPAQVHERSLAAARLLTGEPEFRRADVLMLYLSMPQEVDTAQIALQAWSLSKRVLAPRVSWEQRRMLPIEIRSLTSDVREGQLGIREPLEGLPCPVSEIELVLVPGLMFDERGNRLGRGRGFYDRFLAHRDFRGLACGLAFETQVVEAVPHDERDRRVGMLVTDERVRRFS